MGSERITWILCVRECWLRVFDYKHETVFHFTSLILGHVVSFEMQTPVNDKSRGSVVKWAGPWSVVRKFTDNAHDATSWPEHFCVFYPVETPGDTSTLLFRSQ